LQNPASGAYCYAVLAGGTAQIPASGSLIGDTNCAYWASLGCCISGLNLMIGNFNGTSSCNGEVAPFNNAQLGQILHTCTVNGQPVSASNPVLADVPACAIGGQTVKFIKNTFAITGLVFSYYHDTLTSAGKALFFRALQIDLATAVGMTASQILFLSVGTFTAGTGATVLITFTIRGTSSTDTDGFGALVTLFLAGTTAPSFTAVDAFAAAGNSGIKSGSVGLDRTTSTSTTETQTGASGVAGLSASMMVMFLAMLIAIVLRF